MRARAEERPPAAASVGPWVAAGGALGALARFGISGWVAAWTAASFPWGTLLANVLGSMLLGFFARALPRAGTSARFRALLTTGFCGGFTTFSAFELETLALLQQGRAGLALAYAAVSVAACVPGVLVGMAAAERLSSRGEPTGH